MSIDRFSARGVVVVAVILSATLHLRAQQPGQPKSTAPPSAGSASAQTKAQILSSPQWKQINDEYQKWLSSQAIYTPDDIKRINANLSAQIQNIPASEMRAFVDDWLAKLKVLNGNNFQDAQQWLGTYLSVLTDGYRRQTLQQLGLTDVANMTAAQLDDAILRIRAQQLSTRQSQASYNQAQQQLARMVQQNSAAGSAADQQAGSPGASRFGTNQPAAQAPRFNPPPNRQLPMYVDGYGRIGFGLPF